MKERILFLLAADTPGEAAEAIRSALSAAADADRVSVGLTLFTDDGDEGVLPPVTRLRVMGAATSPREEARVFWQGEQYILAGSPGMRFDRRWDERLIRCLAECAKGEPDRVVLTGLLPRPRDAADAVYPVCARGFDGEGRLLLGRGTPLRWGVRCEISAFVDPLFSFAMAGFLTEAAEESLSLDAFARRMTVRTLMEPVIRLDGDEALPPFPLPDTDVCRRFCAHFGISPEDGTLTAQAREGIFRTDLTPRFRVPAPVRAQESLRAADLRFSRIDALCVTALLGRFDSADVQQVTMVRFRRLCSLRSIALLCYADGARIRTVQLSHPNVLEFKSRYALPVRGRLSPEDVPGFLNLSKPFLLRAARDKFLRHTHYVWLDADTVRMPVYDNAAIDWRPVCSDLINIAEVDGVIDPTAFTVPKERVLPLCAEIEAIAADALEQRGFLPAEAELWETLVRSRPDWFNVIPLPNPGELFLLTMPLKGEEWQGRRR